MNSCLFSGDISRPERHCGLCLSSLTPPVSSGVVQRAARLHRLKVIDAPSHQRNRGPEDGENPDYSAHRQSRAPEQLLSCRMKTHTWFGCEKTLDYNYLRLCCHVMLLWSYWCSTGDICPTRWQPWNWWRPEPISSPGNRDSHIHLDQTANI